MKIEEKDKKITGDGLIKFFNKIEDKESGFWEVYNSIVGQSNKNIMDSLYRYQERFLMSAILEAFICERELSFDEIKIAIGYQAPIFFTKSISIDMYYLIMFKMVKLRFIEQHRNIGRGSPVFEITELGFETLQKQTFRIEEIDSFHNYHTLSYNGITLFSSLKALMGSFVAIFFH